MKNIYFALSLLFIVAFNACKTDLDLIAPYKESVAVYCLLSQSDSVNYVRVNKVFLGAQDATIMAAIKDSVYFKPGEASVYIEKYFNNVLRQTIPCTESYEKPLNPGVFSVNQLIYRTNHKFKVDSLNRLFEYKLVVKINSSGKLFTAKTTLIRDLTNSVACSNASPCFLTPNMNVSIINSTQLSNALTNVKFSAPENTQICSFSMRFYYTEYYNTGNPVQRFVDMDLGSKTLDASSINDVLDFSFSGDYFFNQIANAIKTNNNVDKRMADSVNFIISCAGEAFRLYNDINGTSGAFGQEKPIYTNISDGYGVFSSRYYKKINKTFFNCLSATQTGNILTNGTLSALAKGPITCHLRFNYCGTSLIYVTNTACQ